MNSYVRRNCTWIYSQRGNLAALALVAAALASFPVSTQGVTVADFGFGSMRMNNAQALGSRPLLLIVANYAGTPALANLDWESLIFATNGLSLSAYYREVANGRFNWAGAGLLLPTFSQADRSTNNMPGQIIAAAQAQANFDFATFDANRDRIVTSDELAILIIDNLTDGGGQTRAQSLTLPSPSTTTIRLNLEVSRAAHQESLMTFCHEICHTLGALDLYSAGNGLHSRISLMGPTSATDNNRQSYHLDPWHKLVLGWCEPRIVSLRGGGRAAIPAAQLSRTDAPVLLFDPLRGPSEFYLLEYRTQSTLAVGAGFDINVASQGLMVWHVWQNPDHTPVLCSPHTTLPFPSQLGWTYCKKCTGMYFKPGQPASNCPAGGAHEPLDENTYSMVQNAASDPGQSNWRWCRKCEGMFFGGNALPTRCPEDNGPHDGSQSGNYSLRYQGQPMNGGLNGWRWCSKCQGLFSGGAATAAGVCPVSGQHDGQTSADYRLHYNSWGVFHESAPANGLGFSTAWWLGTTTPASRWFSDVSPVPVQYQPKALLNGGDTLLVEWTSELAPPPFSGETWVDYAFLSPGNGTFLLPYNSLRHAVDASPFYTRIMIKPGSGNEAIKIRQSVRLEAPLGPVTIGR
jgi:M6 family metalloprotease-like protein